MSSSTLLHDEALSCSSCGYTPLLLIPIPPERHTWRLCNACGTGARGRSDNAGLPVNMLTRRVLVEDPASDVTADLSEVLSAADLRRCFPPAGAMDAQPPTFVPASDLETLITYLTAQHASSLTRSDLRYADRSETLARAHCTATENALQALYEEVAAAVASAQIALQHQSRELDGKLCPRNREGRDALSGLESLASRALNAVTGTASRKKGELMQDVQEATEQLIREVRQDVGLC